MAKTNFHIDLAAGSRRIYDRLWWWRVGGGGRSANININININQLVSAMPTRSLEAWLLGQKIERIFRIILPQILKVKTH